MGPCASVGSAPHYTQSARPGTRIDGGPAGSPLGARAIRPRILATAAAEHPMAVERTLSIIKPDATARNQTGAVNALIEKTGLRIIAQKRVRWSRAQAEKFY